MWEENGMVKGIHLNSDDDTFMNAQYISFSTDPALNISSKDDVVPLLIIDLSFLVTMVVW